MSTINHYRNGLLKLEVMLETASEEHTAVVLGYHRVVRRMGRSTGVFSGSYEQYRLRALEEIMLKKLDVERNFYGLQRKRK